MFCLVCEDSRVCPYCRDHDGLPAGASSTCRHCNGARTCAACTRERRRRLAIAMRRYGRKVPLGRLGVAIDLRTTSGMNQSGHLGLTPSPGDAVPPH